ncbi:MAG: response regulator transcription factor, partial [Actinomycetota bacterium]|nr:response regulator transcription factor [Actinomycetota bacterium]
DLHVIGEAAEGRSAITMAAALRPDVVLMDVRMPGMDGIEATARIVTQTPHSRVLILTTFDLDEYVIAGLRSGASGFLLKDAPTADLLAAIRTIAAGDAIIAPSITRRLLDQFAARLPDPTPNRPTKTPLSELTEREQTVFEQLARGRSNKEIASDLFLSEGTVKIHVGRILTKLGLRDRIQAVVLAYETGVITPGH